MNKLGIQDLDLKGKRVLIRVDFNVPVEDGEVGDDRRIVSALPTISHALDAGASVILMSHLGRPRGVPDPALSLRPVAARLAQKLGREVAFSPDCVGPEARRMAEGLQPGQVLLLENLRFHPGEKKPEAEPDFAEQLAALADCYVNDAFGTAHRAHASMVAVARLFPRRAAGFLIAKEIDYFSRALASPKRPFLAILGGAKVSDKIPVIENLLEKVDGLLIGGAMSYTFLKAEGVEVGDSLVEEDLVGMAGRLRDRARRRTVGFQLPRDHVCGRRFEAQTETTTTVGVEIPEGMMGLDIGPATVEDYRLKIQQAGTIVWNGPMGVFEWPAFAAGTMAVARACAESEAVSIVGGGDSASAAAQSGMADRFSHISTGGGASMELLEGKELPGLAVLDDR